MRADRFRSAFFFSLALCVVATIGFQATFDIGFNERFQSRPGPRFLPQLYMLMIAAGGVAGLVRSGIRWRGAGSQPSDESRRHAVVTDSDRRDATPEQTTLTRPPADTSQQELYHRRFLLVGIIVAYLVALPAAGYIVGTILFALALLVALGERSKRVLVLLPLGLSLVLYFVFEHVLSVRLP